MSKSLKKKKKFFIKDMAGIHISNNEFFDSITNRSQALIIGVMCYHEMFKTLISDAINNEDSVIENTKITMGLFSSILELDKKFPSLYDEIKQYNKSEKFNIISC